MTNTKLEGVLETIGRLKLETVTLKAERDELLALVRRFRDYDPTSDSNLYAWRSLDTDTRVLLARIEGGVK